MNELLELSKVASRARVLAGESASAAGVSVREIEDWDEIRAISQLFDRIWRSSEDEPLLGAGMLRAMTHSGNYAAGAFKDDELIGGIVGFLGRDADGPYLHSHILGVSDDHHGGSIGFALKQHQRAWALSIGMRKVTWTFDPLVGRNAFFNVAKLGADEAEYLVSFYGVMSDDVNAGDESDRILVVWHLRDPRVDVENVTRRPEPDIDLMIRSGTVALTPEGSVERSGWGSTVLCATPKDIVAMRKEDPERAAHWRRALRETLGDAMADGYRVTGFSRSGWYVLERP